MSTAPADETESVAKIRLGRLPAEELGRVSDLLQVVARRFGVDGEDFAQETFLKALALGDPGLSIGWFRVACRNLLTDWARQKRRRQEMPLDGLAEPHDHGPQPLDAVVEREAFIKLRQAFISLSPPDQRILELTLSEGLDCRQAGEVLGISHQAARQRRHEALKRLKSSPEIRSILREAFGGAETHV